ncbi:MAG: TIGR02466 family protein [Pseudomonadota bacterium]
MTEPELKVQVAALFPTPVASVRLPDAARINPLLTQRILQRRAETTSIQASNLGGWQSDWEMASWGGPETTAVLEAAKAVANRLTVRRDGQPAAISWRCNAWANVNGPGDANEFHCHPGSFWSGAYYVDDGRGGAPPQDNSGAFEMMDPRGPGPALYAPHLAYAMPQGLSPGSSETLQPVSGLLLLFPAWLLHQVRPYQGQGLRISLAFNLSI